MAAGVTGSFAYLRKRSMMGDALSHATLPGVGVAFLLTSSKHLGVLTAGAVVSGVLGVLAVIGLRRCPRIKEDAAIGIVLSVFFGAGMTLLGIIQSTESGNQAGLKTFIYGKAAAMGAADARLIAYMSGLVLVSAVLLYKESRIVCFDAAFAAAQGWPVLLIDLLMMGLIVLVTVIGLQAVGLILIIALLIIPAAAARFWTESLAHMVILSGLFGAVSGWQGARISAAYVRMPTGAIIVLCAGVIFAVSMLFSPNRGVLAAQLRRWSLRRRIVDQHLLRALLETEERDGMGARLPEDQLRGERGWTAYGLHRVIARAVRRGVVAQDGAGRIGLTERGRVEARRVLRNHRLWELYLIRYADIAPSHVDRDADQIEHVLPEEIVLQLERALVEESRIPPSPHVSGAPS
jgi:manganese/zinc/iron transport system permease protein